MAITRTAMTDDDGSGTTGTIINNAWKTELYNQIDGIGTWTDIAHNASYYPNFTIGSHVLNCYTVIGKTLIWLIGFYGCNVPTALADLTIYPPLPAGVLPIAQSGALGHAYSVPAYGGAIWYFDGSVLKIRRSNYPTVWNVGVFEIAGVITLRYS